jgi:hypothetical protein
MATTLEQPEVGVGQDGIVSDEAKRLAQHLRAQKERQKQSLRLQRANILSQSQKTTNPTRRTALEAALAQIEGQISAIG